MQVPELSRKLKLLMRGGRYASLDDLAKDMGRSPVTLRGWANGNSGTPPDTVPHRAEAALITLFAKALPTLTESDIRALLSAPGDDLEALFAAQVPATLSDLIAREAKRGAGTVYLEEDGLSLVRARRRGQESSPIRIPLGKAFRIEFVTNARGGFVVALQAAPGGWGVTPCSFTRAGGTIHLPGPEEDGETGWMIEDNEIGRHCFIAAQGNRPFPAEIMAAARDGVPLDRALIGHFIRSFEQQDHASRRLLSLELEFIAAGQSPSPPKA